MYFGKWCAWLKTFRRLTAASYVGVKQSIFILGLLDPQHEGTKTAPNVRIYWHSVTSWMIWIFSNTAVRNSYLAVMDCLILHLSGKRRITLMMTVSTRLWYQDFWNLWKLLSVLIYLLVSYFMKLCQLLMWLYFMSWNVEQWWRSRRARGRGVRAVPWLCIKYPGICLTTEANHTGCGGGGI